MQETSIVSYSYLFKIMWAEVKKKRMLFKKYKDMSYLSIY